MKKEIPILFSTPMVKSIDVDIKTQTRRTKGLEKFNENPKCWKFTYRGENLWSAKHKLSSVWEIEFKCPYGQVGDLLWVREKTREAQHYGIEYPFIQYADLTTNTHCKIIDEDQIIYSKWKPSIHMFKEHTRFWLEITNIKIERLQEISHTDSESEGILKYPLPEKPFLYVFKDYEYKENYFQRPDYSFRSLWCSINGKESWIKNQFVWVITFKKVTRP